MALSYQHLGPYVNFHELSLGLKPQHVVGRVIRSWEVRNENNRDQFMGISMVMLDEKDTTIHCFIPPPLAKEHLSTLREGVIFQLGGFEVRPCTKHHKITDHPFVIKFTAETTFVHVATTWIKIGKNKFRVHTHDHLLALANTNLALPDIVGRIISVEGTNLYNPTSTHRILLRLQLQPYNIVSLSLWGQAASRFRSLLYLPIKVKPIVLVTAVNPTILEGILCLDSTLSTKFYFDKNIDPISWFSQGFDLGTDHSFTLTDLTASIHKMETVTIAELCEFTTKSKNQDADFICQATIVDVLSTYGWNHMTCTACVGKLEAHENTLICVECQEANSYVDAGFHVALAVLDGRDVATFLVSDKDIRNFLSPHKYENLRKKVNQGIFPDLLPYLEDIIGNTFSFQIKVTTYNHSPKNRSFTVARISNNTDHVQPTFSTMTVRQNDATGTTNYNFNNNAEAGQSFTIPGLENIQQNQPRT